MSEAASNVRNSATDLKERAEEAATTLAADGKELADKSFAYVNRTIRENPTLAIAGVVAIGALGALLLRRSYTKPQSATRRMQRDLARHTREIRHAIRDELRSSGAADRISDLSRSFASIDWRPFFQPIVDQANKLAKQASDNINSTTK